MANETKIDENLYYDERSAGGIVYKIENGRVYWLLVKTYAKKYQKGSMSGRKLVYKFPKGHLMGNEVLKQAAQREVEEEGRVKTRIVSKIGSRDYILWDKTNFKKIIKKVTFFLMEYAGESNLKHFDMEMVLDRAWYTYEEAIEKLGYDFEKVLLSKARKSLEEMMKTPKK